MLVTPGIIHKLHPAVTNHAMDKIEDRADAFYVMDGSDIDDRDYLGVRLKTIYDISINIKHKG